MKLDTILEGKNTVLKIRQDKLQAFVKKESADMLNLTPRNIMYVGSVDFGDTTTDEDKVYAILDKQSSKAKKIVKYDVCIYEEDIDECDEDETSELELKLMKMEDEIEFVEIGLYEGTSVTPEFVISKENFNKLKKQ